MGSARTWALALLVGLPACVEVGGGGPAGDCAEVVRIYRNLQGAVEIVGQPVETSEGSVEIEYQGMDGMNLPATGSARCTFSVGQGGDPTLLEAVVDGEPLPGPDLEAIRAKLAH